MKRGFRPPLYGGGIHVWVNGLLLLGTGVYSQPLRFDFGPEKAPVFQNFTPVWSGVRYAPERGYGLTEVEREDTDRGIGDDLGRDWVMSEGATFAVDVAKGDYEVWGLLGDCGQGLNPPPFWFTHYAIAANGQPVVAVQQDWHTCFDEYVFKNYRTDWRPRESLWDKYLAKHDRAHRFTGAAEGPIRLTFSGPCLLRALVIYPAAQREALEKDLAGITARR